MDREELIKKYIRGSLSEQEFEVFQSIQATDSEFENEVSFTKDLTLVVDEDERLRLKTGLQKRNKSARRNRGSKKNLIISIIILIIVTILIAYFSFDLDDSSQEIYAEYFDTYPNTYQPVTRNSTDSPLNQAFTSYEKGNFSLANEKFKLSQEQDFDPNTAFFYAISLAATEDLESAMGIMMQVIESDSEYKIEAYWYLALLSLKKDNYDEASDYLGTYLSNAGFKRNEVKAQELLKLLSN